VGDDEEAKVALRGHEREPSEARRAANAARGLRPGVAGSAGEASSLTTIDVVRFPTVLFDLDGTVVDSGAIILASMRHATREVLGREYTDAELLQTVGGPGLEAQMEAFAPEHVALLVDVYRAHNEPLHATLQPFDGILELLPELRRRGHQLGIVTAKRLATVQLAFDRIPLLAETTDVVIGAEDTERHKPDPDPVLEALRRLGARPEEAVYVGDSPFDIRAGKAAGAYAIAVGWGGIHPDERLLGEGPDALVQRPEEILALV